MLKKENKRNEIKIKTIQTEIFVKEGYEELKKIKSKLLAHYHKILMEGKDTRSEGLSWLIKAIWGLGSKVILSYLPNFMDEQSISYLFEVRQYKYTFNG